MVRFLFLLIVLIHSFQGTSFALTVTFNENAEVSSSHIKLADVAIFNEESPLSLALGSRHIAPSPRAGSETTINNKTVIEKLLKQIPKSTDIQWEGASSTFVKRKGVTIGPKKIESAIADFLTQNRDELPIADYSFVPRELPLPFVIPVGDLEVDVVPADPKIIGSRRMSLVYKVDNTIVKNISIRGKLKAMASVAILTQNVKRGAILHPDMVQLQKKDLGKLRTPCTDLREVLGRRLTRSLRTGSVLDMSSIEIPPLIRKGQLVKILINHNGMHLSASGISSMNGKQDQIIRVVNTVSKKMIYCKVSAPGIVEVQI
jgi:flagella basal body P-ring formation protein FlgA